MTNLWTAVCKRRFEYDDLVVPGAVTLSHALLRMLAHSKIKRRPCRLRSAQIKSALLTIG